MRRRSRLLSAFAAVSVACALFVTILWYRSHGPGEAIQWRSVRWTAGDQRIARTLALLTRDGRLTLACHFEHRRIVFRSNAARDQRDPGRTTFHWNANNFMEATTLEPSVFNRLGFTKFAAADMFPSGRPRTSRQVVYRYALPFWFLAFILLLPPAYWIYRRARASVPDGILRESQTSPKLGEIA